jgi:hypothetical protein
MNYQNKKGGIMNKKVSVYNYLISNFDIDNKAVRIAIEAICLMSEEQEQDLVEQLAEEYDIILEEQK